VTAPSVSFSSILFLATFAALVAAAVFSL